MISASVSLMINALGQRGLLPACSSYLTACLQLYKVVLQMPCQPQAAGAAEMHRGKGGRSRAGWSTAFPRGEPPQTLSCCYSGSTDPAQLLQTSENPYPHPTETAFQPQLSGHACSGQMLSYKQEITNSLSHRVSAPANTFWSQHTNIHHKQLSPPHILSFPNLPCPSRVQQRCLAAPEGQAVRMAQQDPLISFPDKISASSQPLPWIKFPESRWPSCSWAQPST